MSTGQRPRSQTRARLIETIDVEDRLVTIAAADGTHQIRPYDRFVLAAGSQVFRPDIPGLSEYGFDTDQLDAALRLDAHLKALAGKPDTAARNTVVVAGGGLTGIEVAAELPGRLRAELGAEAAIRVILIDTADVVGASMGAGPQPHVQEALTECGVESRCGVRVSAVTADSVTLSSGERISANTLVWAEGKVDGKEPISQVQAAAGFKLALQEKSRERRRAQKALSQCERHRASRRNDLLPRLTVEYVSVESLKPARRRVRRATASQMARVRLSLTRHGVCTPILVDTEGRIVHGHVVWETARLGSTVKNPCSNHHSIYTAATKTAPRQASPMPENGRSAPAGHNG